MWAGLELSPLARDHHIDPAPAALGTHEPRVPGEHGRFGTVSLGLLSDADDSTQMILVDGAS
jgi:hypothetical protein